MLKLELKDTPVHCIELNTDRSLTGLLVLSPSRILVSLYNYYDDLHFLEDAPVFLRTENNFVVSLHSNIAGESASSRRRTLTTYRQDVTSNIAVIGPDKWHSTDVIKRVTFRVDHTDELLRHGAKIKALRHQKYPDREHLVIYEERCRDMILGAGYSVTYGMDFDSPKALWPWFSIEFATPRTIDDYLTSVHDYVSFLSFCLGAKLKPSEISISRLGLAELNDAVRAQSYDGDHDVHYVWPEAKIDPHELWVGRAPVRVWDDKELAYFTASLLAWMERPNLWRGANALMMTAFRLRNIVSSERLINSCRWFEEVPLAESRAALTDVQIAAISEAALEKALQLGCAPAVRERIAGAVRWVKAESNEERFRRLIALVEDRFGRGILPPNMLSHLKNGVHFRGKTAHGHFSPDSEADFRAFSKATSAFETLAYLLTAYDLPIPDENRHRIWENLTIRDYLHSYE